MNKKLKIILIAFLAFTSGMFTHAKLYAKTPLNTLRPKPRRRLVRTGSASWYSERSPGIRRRTANNEIFDDEAMTCAMWGAPFNQRLRVTNVSNGKSIIVRVNDRGPHRRYVRRGRIIDLTKSAFRKIGGLKEGIIKVAVEFL